MRLVELLAVDPSFVNHRGMSANWRNDTGVFLVDSAASIQFYRLI